MQEYIIIPMRINHIYGKLNRHGRNCHYGKTFATRCILHIRRPKTCYSRERRLGLHNINILRYAECRPSGTLQRFFEFQIWLLDTLKPTGG